MVNNDVRKAAWEVLLMHHDGDVDLALTAADQLAVLHPESAIAHRVVGDLRYIVARDASEEYSTANAALHLHVARDREALMAAKRLAPDCVDITAALIDVLRVSRMFGPAESEFCRVEKISDPVESAGNNAAYSVHGDEGGDTSKAERVEEAWKRARRTYVRMTVEELFPLAIEKILEFARRFDTEDGLKLAKRVIKQFPDLWQRQMEGRRAQTAKVAPLRAAADGGPEDRGAGGQRHLILPC